MALSFCSFSSLFNSRLTCVRPNGLRCHAQGQAAPPSSVDATRISPQFSDTCERRSANYPPNIWQDGYIQSLTIDYAETDGVIHARTLKEVMNLLCADKELVDQLQLIDTLRQLGVEYHFEKEIEDALTAIHQSIDDVIKETKDDLHATSLLFRLLREHGFYISQDVFNNFSKDNGGFKDYLNNDINGILSLYEASFLAMEREDQMDKARDFTTNCLMDYSQTGVGLEPSTKEKISYALEIPLHWRMQRLHTRWFINQYEKENDMNPMLLKLAKLDFNRVQNIYKKELKELSSWWTDIGLGNKLHFARDRLVENYLWTVGWAFDPKLWRIREATTKANCFITIIDDIYDVYGTLEELELFTDVVARWDPSAIEELPEFMKICFMALYNMTNDTAYEALKLSGVDVLPYLRRAWADVCTAYLLEAKWYHEGYKPTMKEYLDNGCISISGHIALTTAYCTSESLTKESLQCFNFYPDAVYHSSMILRLYDDLATSTAELLRGDVPKSIQCYMHENRVSEAITRQCLNQMIVSTWKKLNVCHITHSTYEKSFKHVALNIPRMAQCIYANGDGYGDPGQETKNHVISLLIQPIQMGCCERVPTES